MRIKVMNPVAPRLYGNLKIHKVSKTNIINAPIRPVVSSVTSPTYLLEKFLCNTIKCALPSVKTEHSVKNSLDLIKRIEHVTAPPHSSLVSLDVKSLFPSVNIERTIDIIEEELKQSSNLSESERAEIKEGLKLVHENNYFQFNNKCYKQVNGCPMGSPLSPLLSEFYMLQFEKEIHKLNPNLVNNIVYLHRYVDDILMLWKGSKRQLDLFLQNANKIYSNFTLELEYGGKEINFLDLNISIHEGKHRFKIYRKPSYTDVIIPASSYHMYNHKMAFFRNMYNRVLEVPLERDDFMSELKTIRNIGENNGYSNYEMKKVFYNTLKNKVEKLLYIPPEMPIQRDTSDFPMLEA
ncbi:hypothetical protein M8J77_017630 [Diaphorina citri]|nr:hypothetical protein M8J77_026138 [Diaphorina citri]KAI5752505.1 hypothetical protein M8J77_017630 [Diaphorina citri]